MYVFIYLFPYLCCDVWTNAFVSLTHVSNVLVHISVSVFALQHLGKCNMTSAFVFLDALASLEPTQVGRSVGRSVGDSFKLWALGAPF